MKNQTLNIGRFLTYFRFQINLLGRGYLLAYTAALFIGLTVSITLIAVDCSSNYEHSFPEELQGVVLFGFGVLSVMIGTRMYARLGKREYLMGFLTVPASHLEKTIVSFLLSFVFPALICLMCYLVCEQAMLAYFRNHALPPDASSGMLYLRNYYGQPLWRLMFDLGVSEYAVLFMMSIYLAVHSFFIMGSLIFRKFSFILTSISLALLIFFSVSLVILLSIGILGNDRISHLDGYILSLGRRVFGTEFVSLEDREVFIFLSTLFLSTSAVIWIVTHLKLKEKEAV